MDPHLVELIEEGPGSEEVELILKLRPNVPLPPDVRIVTRFGDIATCRVARHRIRATWEHPSTVSVKAPRYVAPEPIQNEANGRRESHDHTDEGRPAGLPTTGCGIVTGFLDWGLDFAHPNFCHDDGSTRILALWDQSNQTAGADVPPYGYGKVFTRRDIDRALAARNPYQALGYQPALADPFSTGTHGTHTCDIAAGNGRAPGSPVGIAPEVDIVFVHLAARGIGGLATLGDGARILEGLDFIRHVAGSRPWVVNMSLGRCGGPHTGLTLVEQGMDALLLEAPGRCIVQSTGNYYGDNVHAAGHLRPGERRTLTWRTDAADVTPNELEVWYSGRDTFGLEIRPPESDEVYCVPLGEQCRIEVNGREVAHFYHRAHDPSNGDHHIDLFLRPSAAAGGWSVTLIGEDIVDGRFHAWIERDSGCAHCQSRFDPADAVATTTTGTICNGFRTIVVGAYDHRSLAREPARFSSAGPTADGRDRPHLCAPGVSILAARSAPRDERSDYDWLTRKSGTSMASPHAAGTIACMFEAARRPLSIHETHELLLGSLRNPSAAWATADRLGYGYLDIERAVEAACSHGNSSWQGQATSYPPSEGGTVNRENGISSVGTWGATPIQVMDAPGSAHVTGSDLVTFADEIISDGQVHHSGGLLYELLSRGGVMPQRRSAGAGPAGPKPVAMLFDAMTSNRYPQLRDSLGRVFEVVATPRARLNETLQPGDCLFRRARGVGDLAHLAVLVDGDLIRAEELGFRGLRPEGRRPGLYAHVIEAGPFAHLRQDKFARLVADENGRLAPDSLIVRLRGAGEPAVEIDTTTFEVAAEEMSAVLQDYSLQQIADGTLGTLPDDILEAILARDESDANSLTDDVFRRRHPEFVNQVLDPNNPKQRRLRDEWAAILARHVKPIIWLRQLIANLDRYRGDIPREFLLGWIAVESDGRVTTTTSLGERGYFQIMWRTGEAKEQLGLTQADFERLSTDREFSIEKGVQLAQKYRQHFRQKYPSVPDGSDLLWRLTKGRHGLPVALDATLRRLVKADLPITWQAVSENLPKLAAGVDHTMAYAAKLKPLADRVPVLAQVTEVYLGEQGSQPRPPITTMTPDGIDVYADNDLPSLAAIRNAGFSFFLHETSGVIGNDKARCPNKRFEKGVCDDEKFRSRWEAAGAEGLIRGGFHYYRHHDEVSGDAQAERVVRMVYRLVPGDLAPALDFEEQAFVADHSHPNGAEWRPELKGFLDTLEKRLGRIPIIYTRQSVINMHLADTATTVFADFANYPLWLVRYRDQYWNGINLDTEPRPMTAAFREAAAARADHHYRNRLTNPPKVLPEPWKTGSTWAIWQYSPHTPGSMLQGRPFTDFRIDLNVANGVYTLRGLADMGRPGVALLGASRALGVPSVTYIAHTEPDANLHLMVGPAWTDTNLSARDMLARGADPVLLASSDALFLYYRSGNDLIEATATQASQWRWRSGKLAALPSPIHDPRAVVKGDRRWVVYWGDDDDWHLQMWNSNWSSLGGLLSRANVRTATRGRSTGQPVVYVSQGVPHVVGRVDGDGDLYDVWLNGSAWRGDNITAEARRSTPNLPAATYSPCAYETSAGVAIAFRAVGGDIWVIERSNYRSTNVTAATAAKPAAGHPTCFVLNDGPHIVYRATDKLIYDLWLDRNRWRVAKVCITETASDPVATSDGAIGLVAVRANDGMILSAQFDGTLWTCVPTVRTSPLPAQSSVGDSPPSGGRGATQQLRSPSAGEATFLEPHEQEHQLVEDRGGSRAPDTTSPATFDGGKLWTFKATTYPNEVAVFCSQAALGKPQVEVLLYAHGLLDRCPGPQTVTGLITHWPFILGHVVAASGRPTVLVVPKLDWETSKKAAWTALTQPGNVNKLVEEVLVEVGKMQSSAKPAVCNLVIAGHSKAYEILEPLAAAYQDGEMQTGALAKLSEVWLLDTTYGAAPIDNWTKWLRANGDLKVSVFYNLGGRAKNKDGKPIGTWTRGDTFYAKRGGHLGVERVSEAHCDIPAARLPALLAALPPPLTCAPSHESESAWDGYDRGEVFDLAGEADTSQERDAYERFLFGESDDDLALEAMTDDDEDAFGGDYEDFEHQDELYAEYLPEEDGTNKIPLALPVGDPVPFAPAPPIGSYWPVRTSRKNARVVSYMYEAPSGIVGREGRMFLARRKGERNGKQVPRWHVGVDLYANVGDTVLACEDGQIVEFSFFYNANSGQRTYKLLVQHDASGVVVNYGEVTADSLRRNGLKVGMRVTAGQPIGFVSDTSMLHFETYVDGTTTTHRWWKDEKSPPAELLNPTRYLLFLREYGLPRRTEGDQSVH